MLPFFKNYRKTQPKMKKQNELIPTIIAVLLALLLFSCTSSRGYYKENKFSNNGCGGNAVPVFKMK